MSTWYVRTDDQTVLGPYEPAQIRAWIDEGRLERDIACSPDESSWRPATEVAALCRRPAPSPAPMPAAPAGLPEPTLLIRQGANVQGPYSMTRLRGYVAQRRVQPYMLFSQDGVFWLAPEHVPGLLPPGYVPLPPPARPTAVPPEPGAPVPQGGSSVLTMPPGSAPPKPGEDIGSSTLVGFRLDEQEMAPVEDVHAGAAPSPALPETPLAPAGDAAQYHVRLGGHDVYGPCSKDELKAWIAEGRVDRTSEVSTDGRGWRPITGLPGLFPGGAPRRIPGGAAATPDEAAPLSARRKRFRGRR